MSGPSDQTLMVARKQKILLPLLFIGPVAAGAYFFFFSGSPSKTKPISEVPVGTSTTQSDGDRRTSSRELAWSLDSKKAHAFNQERAVTGETSGETVEVEGSEDTQARVAAAPEKAQVLLRPIDVKAKAEGEPSSKRFAINEIARLSKSGEIAFEDPREPVRPPNDPEPKEKAIAAAPANGPTAVQAAAERPAPVAPLVPPPSAPPVPLRRSAVKSWLWAGSGINYQYYQQSVPELGQAKFQNVQGPTWLARGGFQGTRFGLDLAYRETPGRMGSSETVIITNGRYKWTTLSTEALFRPGAAEWNLRFGFQHHLAPFMSRDPIDAIIDVKTNTLTMLTLGMDRAFPVSERLRTEWQVRYQYPLLVGATSAADFKMTPNLAFDGSVGGVVQMSERARFGVFWHGQLHQYRFEYKEPNQAKLTGEQTLFYSNIEVRLGLEF